MSLLATPRRGLGPVRIAMLCNECNELHKYTFCGNCNFFAIEFLSPVHVSCNLNGVDVLNYNFML